MASSAASSLTHTTIKWGLEKVTLGRCCDYISEPPSICAVYCDLLLCRSTFETDNPTRSRVKNSVVVLLDRGGSGGVSKVQVVEIRGPEILGLCGVVR